MVSPSALPDSVLILALEHHPDVIMIVDREFIIRYINRAPPHLTKEEIIGKHCYEFLHPDHKESSRQKLQSVFNGEGPTVIEQTVLRPDGTLAYYQSHLIALPCNRKITVGQEASTCNDYKNIEFALVASTNITLQKADQMELLSYSASLQAAQEQERLHLARELHDGLGQLVTTLQTDLGWLIERLQGNPELSAKLQNMSTLTKQTINAIREISSRLRPSILDDLGLCAAIDWLAEQTCTKAGINTTIHYPSEEKLNLSPERSLTLFRICQEALTNVVRHSHAKEVSIILTIHGSEIILEISDDGCGFPLSIQGNSIGILGMKERAALCGGTTTIDSAPGKGTVVKVILPQG